MVRDDSVDLGHSDTGLTAQIAYLARPLWHRGIEVYVSASDSIQSARFSSFSFSTRTSAGFTQHTTARSRGTGLLSMRTSVAVHFSPQSLLGAPLWASRIRGLSRAA